MTAISPKTVRTQGRVVGLLSGLLFVFTLGLFLWFRIGAWNGSKWAIPVFLVADLTLVLLSMELGGWIAKRLLPPASESDATGFGILSGIVLDLYFCFLLEALDGPNHLAHLNWDKASNLLANTIQGSICGLPLAIGWGAATALSIRKALQPKSSSNTGESLES